MATRRAAWHCPRVSTALLDLVHARAPLAQVAAALEALSHDERVAVLRTLGRAEQRWLFEVADPDIDLQSLFTTLLAQGAFRSPAPIHTPSS